MGGTAKTRAASFCVSQKSGRGAFSGVAAAGSTLKLPRPSFLRSIKNPSVRSSAVPPRMGAKARFPAAPSRGRNFRILLFLTALFSFALRLAVARELAAVNGGVNSVFTPSSATDLCTYMRLAEAVFEGKYEGVFYYQPFYYAVFLPAVRLIAGAGVWKVVFFQCLLGGLTSYFAGLAGALLFGRRAGLFAALFTAVSVPLLLYAPFHQNETLQTFNIVLLFFLALRAVRFRRLRDFFFAGLVCGVGILTRGNLWFFVPVLLAAMLLAGRHDPRRTAGRIALFLAPMLLVQLPFSLHNTRILGRFSGPSTAADAVLALGNTREAPPGGRNPGLPAGPMEYPEAYHRAMALSTRGVSVPRQMLVWLREEPGAFLELQFRKLLLFWDAREIPNNVSLYGEGQASVILRNMYPGSSAVLLACALAGIFFFAGKLFRGGRTGLLLLYGFVLLYWGAVAAFYILSRFRAPVLPLAAIFAGGFLACALPRLRNRKALPFLALLILAAVWITSFSFDFYRSFCEAAVMRLVRPQGTVLPAQPGYPEVRFDHGPFTFGGWTTAEVKPGTCLEKRFSAPGQRVVWTLFSPIPGDLVARIPGGETAVFPLKKGSNELALPLGTDRAIFEVLAAPPGVCAVYDAQRAYGRSSLDGRPLPGEWIARASR